MTDEEKLARRRARYQENKEELRKKSREYWNTHKEKRAEYKKAYYSRPGYSIQAAAYKAKREGHAPADITPERAAEMRAAQDACAICDRKVSLVFDHCHKTGRVRGLICFMCNSGIGLFRESLDLVSRAKRYLEESVEE